MYATLMISGEPYIFMSLEFAPRDEVIEWANDILRKHHDHKAMIVTHSFLYINGERTQPGANHHPHSYKGTMDGNDGERSEEHTSELQSRGHLVFRLLLE